MTSIGRTKELHPMQGIGGFLKVSFFTMETRIFSNVFLPCWDGNLRAEFAKLVSNTSCLVVHFLCAISSVSILFFLLFKQISNVRVRHLCSVALAHFYIHSGFHFAGVQFKVFSVGGVAGGVLFRRLRLATYRELHFTILFHTKRWSSVAFLRPM